jgi:hypothetical protein
MKPGARYIVIEMARRMAKINGSANSKKGDLAKAAGFDQIRLSEAAIVIDYSIENDLRDEVIRVLCKRSARDIVEVGRRLNESKSMLKHGQCGCHGHRPRPLSGLPRGSVSGRIARLRLFGSLVRKKAALGQAPCVRL